MKNLKIKQLTSLLLPILVLIPFSLFSTTYTAVVSGNWNSALTWGGNMPGTTISGEDQIIISAGVTVNMNVDLEINNQLAVMTLLGNLENAEHNLTLTAGTITGTGELLVQELRIGAMGVVATTGNIFCDYFESASTSLALQGTLHVSQMLKLMAGELQLENTGEIMLNTGATVHIGGGSLFAGEGSLQAMGAYNILYTGDADTTGAETTFGTIANLTLQLSSSDAMLALSNNLTVTDTCNLIVGILDLNGQHLTLEGEVQNEINASVEGDFEAGITINGNANATVVFTTNGQNLDTLIIDQDGGSFTLGSDLAVHQLIHIEQGECVMDGHKLWVNGQLNTQAEATITTDQDAELVINGMGNVHIFLSNDTSEIGTLVISQMNGDVSFQSDLEVYATLNLMDGHLILNDHDLTLQSGAVIMGGTSNEYVLTNGEGTLNFTLMAGADATLFPVGSDDGYFPCLIAQNDGASDTQIEVQVISGVFAGGETGADLTASESLVDHTWLISQTDANASVDLNFEFFWEAEAAVNGFDPDNCFISHYVNGAWDVTAAAEATVQADGSFSIARENITSLSPFRVKDAMALSIAPPEKEYLYFDIYPNPASEYINIELPEKLNTPLIEIYDQMGNLIFQQVVDRGAKKQRISLDGLPAGMYLVKMEGAVGERFVKEK